MVNPLARIGNAVKATSDYAVKTGKDFQSSLFDNIRRDSDAFEQGVRREC